MKSKFLIVIAMLFFISISNYAQRVEPVEQPIKVVDEFRQQMGNGLLKLKSNHLPLGQVSNVEIKTDSLLVINNSEEDMVLTYDRVPAYITVKTVPEVIKPQQQAAIFITYDASKNVDGNNKQQWGAINDRINVIINGDKDGSARNIITVSSNIFEDFSHYTKKQLADAPIIEFETKDYNFGTVEQGTVVKYDFTFKNLGKNDLEIRKVKAGWGCTAASNAGEAVKKGESSTVSVTFNTHGKTGKQSKSITVITNDPNQSTIMLRISGEVKAPESGAPLNNTNTPVKH